MLTRCLIFLLFAAVLLNAAEAPFQYPDGSKVEAKDESGHTWRENVVVKGQFADVKKTLSVNLGKAGFKIKHDIPLSANPPSALMAWTKGDKTLLVMVFEAGAGEVCFSWGFFDE
jgi:hypothetical protein